MCACSFVRGLFAHAKKTRLELDLGQAGAPWRLEQPSYLRWPPASMSALRGGTATAGVQGVPLSFTPVPFQVRPVWLDLDQADHLAHGLQFKGKRLFGRLGTVVM